MSRSDSRNQRQLSTSRQTRQRDGAVLVEGVVATCLIIAVTVLAVLLMINVGLSLYYKQKIAFAAQQAAAWAAGEYAWGGFTKWTLDPAALELDTKAVVNDKLQKMGLIPKGGSATVTTTLGTNDVTVSVTVDNLQLVGKTGVFPAFISMSDTAVSPFTSGEPPALVLLETPNATGYTDNTNGVLVPAYGLSAAPGQSGYPYAHNLPFPYKHPFFAYGVGQGKASPGTLVQQGAINNGSLHQGNLGGK